MFLAFPTLFCTYPPVISAYFTVRSLFWIGTTLRNTIYFSPLNSGHSYTCSEFSGSAPVFCHHYKLPPLFRSRYKLIVHCYYCFFSSEDFFAFFPHSDRTTRPLTPSMLGKRIVHWAKYTRYESETHKRQKYKWVISVVLKLRQAITETNCTQSRESKLKTTDIWAFLVSHVNQESH